MTQKCKNSRKNAFTLVEVLTALAITAVLLAAVAVAFGASFDNYQENQRIYQSSITARQAMARMTAQLRTAIAVDPDTPADRCSLITHFGNDITYKHDPQNNTLVLITNANNKSYVLCQDVADVEFIVDSATEGSDIYVKSVRIKLTVGTGSNSQTLAGAAVIRKNLHR